LTDFKVSQSLSFGTAGCHGHDSRSTAPRSRQPPRAIKSSLQRPHRMSDKVEKKSKKRALEGDEAAPPKEKKAKKDKPDAIGWANLRRI
jgi:hypothetical protein